MKIQVKNMDKEKKHYERLQIDYYFLNIANLVGTRGTCDRGRTGCVIVKDRQILVTGYVGSPIGMLHCDDYGHQIKDNHCIATSHAELNAIANAAKRGIAIEGATIYCKMFPCYTCAKLLVNTGIKKVVAEYDYQSSKESKEMFNYLGIDYKIINNNTMNYEQQQKKS